MISQHAPRGITILIAAIFVVIGLVGTFLGLIPAIAGIAGTTIGVAAFVAATIIMLFGVFVRGA